MKYHVSTKRRLKYMRHMNKLRYLENGYFHFIHMLQFFIPIVVAIMFAVYDIRFYIRNQVTILLVGGELLIVAALWALMRYLSIVSTGESYNMKEEALEFYKGGFIYSYLDHNDKKERNIVSLSVRYKDIKYFAYDDYTGFIRIVGIFSYTYYVNGHISEKSVKNEIHMINDFEKDFVKVCSKNGVNIHYSTHED